MATTSSRRTPSLRHHKPRDLGFVELNGHRHYLGPWGRAATEQAYHRLVGEWLANGRELPIPAAKITVSQLIRAFWQHAKVHYRHPDGTATSELGNYKTALRPLRKLYGTTRAADFGPLALKAVRAAMVKKEWVRTNVNKQVSRIKAVFRWGVENEMVEAGVYQALLAVGGLARGRSDALESEPVRPVPDSHIQAIEPHVSRQVWALVQLQLLTAARSGELIQMRPKDLDTTGQVWVYRPVSHKTAHHGHERAIYVGPAAQAALGPFLSGRPLDGFCFDPREAEAERREEIHLARKTPLSQGNRPGTNRKAKPRRHPKDRYTTESYRRAIVRACDRAEVPRWHPHQLRHNAATFLRKEFGIEAARVILGHRSAAITETYAELDQERAMEVVGKVG